MDALQVLVMRTSRANSVFDYVTGVNDSDGEEDSEDDEDSEKEDDDEEKDEEKDEDEEKEEVEHSDHFAPQHPSPRFPQTPPPSPPLSPLRLTLVPSPPTVLKRQRKL
jgi:hypothetical protein